MCIDGFFATEIGFDADTIEIATFESESEGDCLDAVTAALDSDMMFVAADGPESTVVGLETWAGRIRASIDSQKFWRLPEFERARSRYIQNSTHTNCR